MQTKLDTLISVLCGGFPAEIATYMNYCKNLRFEERPDYSYLKRMLKDLFFRENYQYDYIFDWTILNLVWFRQNAGMKSGIRGLREGGDEIKENEKEGGD